MFVEVWVRLGSSDARVWRCVAQTVQYVWPARPQQEGQQANVP